jgi:hypothetical protein
MLEIYAKGVFAGAATANKREEDKIGICHDFVNTSGNTAREKPP